MAIFIGASVENFICGDDINNGHYFIFLTNQTFTVQLVYSMVYFVYILWIFCAKLKEKHQGLKKDQSPAFHDQQYRLPVVCKILWITINILNVVPYVVTLIYWAILFRAFNILFLLFLKLFCQDKVCKKYSNFKLRR